MCLVVGRENVGRGYDPGRLPARLRADSRTTWFSVCTASSGACRIGRGFLVNSPGGPLPTLGTSCTAHVSTGHHGGQRHERVHAAQQALRFSPYHARANGVTSRMPTSGQTAAVGLQTRADRTKQARTQLAMVSWLHATHHSSTGGRPAGTLRTFGRGNEHRLHRMPSSVDRPGRSTHPAGPR